MREGVGALARDRQLGHSRRRARTASRIRLEQGEFADAAVQAEEAAKLFGEMGITRWGPSRSSSQRTPSSRMASASGPTRSVPRPARSPDPYWKPTPPLLRGSRKAQPSSGARSAARPRKNVVPTMQTPPQARCPRRRCRGRRRRLVDVASCRLQSSISSLYVVARRRRGGDEGPVDERGSERRYNRLVVRVTAVPDTMLAQGGPFVSPATDGTASTAATAAPTASSAMSRFTK